MGWSDKIVDENGKKVLNISIDDPTVLAKSINDIGEELLKEKEKFPHHITFSFFSTFPNRWQNNNLEKNNCLPLLVRVMQHLSRPVYLEFKNNTMTLSIENLQYINTLVNNLNQQLSLSFHIAYPLPPYNPYHEKYAQLILEIIAGAITKTHLIDVQIHDLAPQTGNLAQWTKHFVEQMQKMKTHFEYSACEQLLQMLGGLEVDEACALAYDAEKKGYFGVLPLLAEHLYRRDNPSLAYQAYSAISPNSPHYQLACKQLISILDSLPQEDRKEILDKQLNLAVACDDQQQIKAILSERCGSFNVPMPENFQANPDTIRYFLSIFDKLNNPSVMTKPSGYLENNFYTHKQKRSYSEDQEDIKPSNKHLRTDYWK